MERYDIGLPPGDDVAVCHPRASAFTVRSRRQTDNGYLVVQGSYSFPIIPDYAHDTAILLQRLEILARSVEIFPSGRPESNDDLPDIRNRIQDVHDGAERGTVHLRYQAREDEGHRPQFDGFLELRFYSGYFAFTQEMKRADGTCLEKITHVTSFPRWISFVITLALTTSIKWMQNQ
jgi:hypothetical protein